MEQVKQVGSEVRLAELVPGDMFEASDGRRFVVLEVSEPRTHYTTGEPILTTIAVRYRYVGARTGGGAAMRAYDRRTLEPKVAIYAGRAPAFKGV